MPPAHVEELPHPQCQQQILRTPKDNIFFGKHFYLIVIIITIINITNYSEWTFREVWSLFLPTVGYLLGRLTTTLNHSSSPSG